jgi:hypothetical protein
MVGPLGAEVTMPLRLMRRFGHQKLIRPWVAKIIKERLITSIFNSFYIYIFKKDYFIAFILKF